MTLLVLLDHWQYRQFSPSKRQTNCPKNVT